MDHHVNELGQPLSFEVDDWQPPAVPTRQTMEGRWCRLEPLAPTHAEDLFSANALDVESRNWTYLGYGPFATLADYSAWMEPYCTSSDPMFFAVLNAASGQAVGVASFLRIHPDDGSIEVGHINFSPLLQRTPAATEAMYLMMAQAFALGNRRYEWKCNALNAPSRAAAQRLGFSFEGIFRQARVDKGRNRDTAWYSITDSEWPALREAFVAWLDPANFDEEGQQRVRLSDLTHPLVENPV
jgi:RimJ/RimL family protein N-acetyltransferase